MRKKGFPTFKLFLQVPMRTTHLAVLTSLTSVTQHDRQNCYSKYKFEALKSEILTAILLQHMHWLEDHFYYLTSWQQADGQQPLPFHSQLYLHMYNVTSECKFKRIFSLQYSIRKLRLSLLIVSLYTKLSINLLMMLMCFYTNRNVQLIYVYTVFV